MSNAPLNKLVLIEVHLGCNPELRTAAASKATLNPITGKIDIASSNSPEKYLYFTAAHNRRGLPTTWYRCFDYDCAATGLRRGDRVLLEGRIEAQNKFIVVAHEALHLSEDEEDFTFGDDDEELA